jgi:hypothetical protein
MRLSACSVCPVGESWHRCYSSVPPEHRRGKVRRATADTFCADGRMLHTIIERSSKIWTKHAHAKPQRPQRNEITNLAAWPALCEVSISARRQLDRLGALPGPATRPVLLCCRIAQWPSTHSQYGSEFWRAICRSAHARSTVFSIRVQTSFGMRVSTLLQCSNRYND